MPHVAPRKFVKPHSGRGFTLVELMVTVAILGILAAMATTAYMKHLDKGRVAQMKQYAMEVEKGQKEYASRNGEYLDPSSNTYSSGDDEWEKLLQFDPDGKNPDTKVMTTAGGSGDSCSFCGSSTTDGMQPDNSDNWYAIIVCRDMDGSNTTTQCDSDTAVYLDNVRGKPVSLRVGD